MNSPDACLVCASNRIAPAPFGYSYEGTWLQAWSCRACGIIFLFPQLNREELSALYSKEYFGNDFRCGHEGEYFEEQTLAKLGNDPLLAAIREFKSAGRFLEIGCAGGAFLDSARRAGFEVQGVELSADAAEFARQRFGLDVFTGDLFDARLPGQGFDVVLMGDVLEHLPAPVETLKEVHRILRPEGLLVLLVPSQTNTLFSRAGFAAYRILGRHATVNMRPYHLFEYRPRSMRNILLRTGFSIARMDAGLIPPGQISLRGSAAQNAGKKLFQYPNRLLTSMTGLCGDRLNVYAIKHG